MKQLSACDLNSVLGTGFIAGNVYFLRSAGSTQDLARTLVSSGAGEGTVVIAETQTMGKGRRGAGWASPPGGLWMSVVLFPPGNTGPAILTLAGAAAAAGAIGKAAGLKAVIKWPNDCFVNGKKAAGIIGEKSGGAVIVGIGVNLNIAIEAFPPELRGTATSLSAEKGYEIDENIFLKELLKEFEVLYSAVSSGETEEVISRLKELSGVPGRSVSGSCGGKKVEGTAVGFGEDGSLVIRLDSGLHVNFAAGELALEKETIES